MKKLISVVAALSLLLVACTPSQQIVLLDAAVAASDAVLTSLAATGNIDPVTAAEVVAVITPIPAVSNAILAEWNSADSAALKVAKIGVLTKPIIASLSTVSPAAAPYLSATLAAWNAFLVAVDPTFTPATPSLAKSKFVLLPTNANMKTLQADIAKMQADLEKFPVKAVTFPPVK